MNGPAGDLASRYGPIGAGLLIGTAAKYGLTLNEGQPITWRAVAADLLLQGALGLIAIAASDVLGLTGNARVFVGALAALNSARLVSWARDTFFKRVQQTDLTAAANAAPGPVVVPAGTGEPVMIGAQPETVDHPVARAGTALKSAYRGSTRTRPPADQIELLRKLPPA